MILCLRANTESTTENDRGLFLKYLKGEYCLTAGCLEAGFYGTWYLFKKIIEQTIKPPCLSIKFIALTSFPNVKNRASAVHLETTAGVLDEKMNPYFAIKVGVLFAGFFLIAAVV